MMMMIPTLFELWIVVVIALAVYVITYFGVYHPMFRLSILNVFNRKPFSCWLCSNFWLSTFIWLNLAYINVWFILWGMVLTSMTTYVIHADPMP